MNKKDDERVLEILEKSDKWLSMEELSAIIGLPVHRVKCTLHSINQQIRLTQTRKKVKNILNDFVLFILLSYTGTNGSRLMITKYPPSAGAERAGNFAKIPCSFCTCMGRKDEFNARLKIFYVFKRDVMLKMEAYSKFSVYVLGIGGYWFHNG